MISEKQTWDLEVLYPSPEAWEKDFNRIRPLAEAFLAFRGRLAESPAVLRDATSAPMRTPPTTPTAPGSTGSRRSSPRSPTPAPGSNRR